MTEEKIKAVKNMIEPDSLLAGISSARLDSLLDALLRLSQECIFFSKKPASGPEEAVSPEKGSFDRFSGLMGGSPLVDLEEPWPLDRHGTPLNLVAQLPVPGGPERLERLGNIFALFLSGDYPSCQEKSSGWFKIMLLPAVHPSAGSAVDPPVQSLPEIPLTCKRAITIREDAAWIAHTGATKEEAAALSSLMRTYNRMNASDCQLFGDFGLDGWRASIVAAFHANGVSFNETRLNDPHFKHLIDDAANWFAFLKLREKSIWKLTDGRSLLFCARREDYAEGSFDRVRPVFVSEPHNQ